MNTKTYIANINSWIQSLSVESRESFLEQARNCVSLIELCLYARMLQPAFDGCISELEKWHSESYQLQDLRATLRTEAEELEQDIKGLRILIRELKLEGQSKEDDPILKEISIKSATEVSGKIASLENQLRGNIVALLQLKQDKDSRALQLAGAEKMINALKAVYSDSPEMIAMIDTLAGPIYADICAV